MKRNQRVNQVGSEELLERNGSGSSSSAIQRNEDEDETVITGQPVKKLMDLPIINAHEFAPHPSINILSAFDVLVVRENSEFYSKYTGDMKRNKYQVVTDNGSLIYTVIEGRCFKCLISFKVLECYVRKFITHHNNMKFHMFRRS